MLCEGFTSTQVMSTKEWESALHPWATKWHSAGSQHQGRSCSNSFSAPLSHPTGCADSGSFYCSAIILQIPSLQITKKKAIGRWHWHERAAKSAHPLRSAALWEVFSLPKFYFESCGSLSLYFLGQKAATGFSEPEHYRLLCLSQPHLELISASFIHCKTHGGI